MAKTKLTYSLITFLSGFSGVKAYAVILGVLLICGLGVPIPEDITLIAAGILAALGNISFAGAVIAGFVGVLLGDTILFFLGRKYGYHVFKLPVFRTFFTEARISLARQKILQNSKFICFFARFLPGLRAPIYLTAGIMGVRPIVFILLDGFAAAISVPVWIYVGWFFGNNLDTAVHYAFKMQKYLMAGVAVIVLAYIWWKMRQHRKEKELLAKAEPAPIPDALEAPIGIVKTEPEEDSNRPK